MDYSRGKSYPLGATVTSAGVNFSIFSNNATRLELLLFDAPEAIQASKVIPLNPDTNRTFYYWHIFVPGLKAGQLYGYRAYGPFNPHKGMRYDPSKVLVDPYAKAVAYGNYQREIAKRYGEDNLPWCMKSVVVDPDDYDWEGDEPLQRPYDKSIIYELHVGGFTRHPNSGVAPGKRGTYAGLVEKIPYLKELGIKTIELMPVQQFDPQASPQLRPNYWGYQPIAYFAPHCDYSARRDPCGPVDEFRDMVKALHRAGIEVILDVVYNHTAEEDQTGPTLSYRGLENETYYMLNSDNPAEYQNYSGTGNTLNANNSIVRRLILESLRYWVETMHVDGFRFDLASVLSRGIDGELHPDPPVLWSIESDPVLAGAKIIAEAWDASGLYQVTNFIGLRWAVWNGLYRDTVRRFVKSDPGQVSSLADAIVGSPNLFNGMNQDPVRSINYIASHDGFTMNDLVSYNEKHNWENGYDNEDGARVNFSWNCGVEGPADDPQVEALRVRQIKNILTILCVSQGRPMLLMGDEARRTQHGNNNAFNQDNKTSWFDWENLQKHAEIFRFAKILIRNHQNSCLLRDRQLWANSNNTEVRWHGTQLNQPNWGYDSHSLAFELINHICAEQWFVILNAYWQPLEFEIPALPENRSWRRLVDTNLPTPEDISEQPTPLPPETRNYRLGARSVVVLIYRQD
jgi:glycogen operon protein